MASSDESLGTLPARSVSFRRHASETDANEESWSEDSDAISEIDSLRRDSYLTMDALCANTLIDNNMAITFNRPSNHGQGGPRLHKALTPLTGTESDGHNSWVASGSTSTVGVNQRQVASVYTKSSGGSNASRAARNKSSESCESTVQDSRIRALFAEDAVKNLQPHHLRLVTVAHCTFALEQSDEAAEGMTSALSAKRKALIKKLSDDNLVTTWRHKVTNLATCTPFTMFFMVLTLYALFGPDIVFLCGDNRVDDPFLVLNTVIFFLFIFEFIVLSLGVMNYVCTMAAVLDLVAIFSLLSDTWFLQDGALSGNQALSDSRMARLTRVTRVARVTKLVPRMIGLLRGLKSIRLARQLLERRLYRTFQYLDSDRDGLLSSFDLKVFYLTILQECSHMLTRHKHELIEYDGEILLASAPEGNVMDEQQSNLDFVEFTKVFLSTALGHDVLMYHLRDMQDSQGVWKLTATVTDRTAIKVCAGILLLTIVMKVLDNEEQELSAQQSLFHLYALHNQYSHLNSTSIADVCSGINVLRQELKVLFLYMAGRAWVDYGSSLCPAPFVGNPFNRIDAILDLTRLRFKEATQACLPNFETHSFAWHSRTCNHDTTVAIVLIDNAKEVKKDVIFHALSLLCTMIIMLVFLIAFSTTISAFSRTTLHPLRALVDDMMALSAIELVHVDADIPWRSGRKEQSMVTELQHLQNSFKSMRGAIRSWSRYVPPSVVQKLFNAGMEATIGVSKTVATILFIDVDGFEDACRGKSPDEVNLLLATVFEKIAFCVAQYRGTLLEFIGDEVLAVYNTPNAVRSHIYSAVMSALDIHKQIATLPPLLSQDGRQLKIQCRCGVHSAVILAGNIGSLARMKYGLLGDGVNLTARLKGLNSRYNTQTIASENVFSNLVTSQRAVFRPLDRVAVKGKSEPVTIYEIMWYSNKSDYSQKMQAVAKKHAEAFVLYHDQKFVEAKAMFKEVASDLEALKPRLRLAASTQDQPSRQMAKRCTMYIKNPPGPDWDGVERLQAKTFQVSEEEKDDATDGSSCKRLLIL